jgi:hypothetical protein
MLHRIEAAQIATSAEIDIDTLEERLIAEQSASDATGIAELMFGAIARLK